jgi:hypothetical protein
MRVFTAIDTQYNGYLFRSRLEARWAVFFDAMRARYEYEREGYHLPSGDYLPDFWLPDLRCWVEIKPEAPTDHEQTLCEELAEGTDSPAVIVSGAPGNEVLRVYCTDFTDSSGGTDRWEGDSGDCSCPSPHWAFAARGRAVDGHGGGGRLVICSGNSWLSRSFFAPGGKPWDGMLLVRDCVCSSASIAAAYRAARSARFERGRKGRR